MVAWFLNLSFFAECLLVFFVGINILTFFYFGFDKMRSQLPGARRVRENTLWLLAAIGGSIGAAAGMHFFRHKTQKVSFQAGLAIIFAAHITALYFLLS